MMSMGKAVQPHAPRGEEELPRMTITLTELIKRLQGLKETKWPPRMTTDPVKRDNGRYCAFHVEHDHATYECRQLKIEVNRLVKEGFFRDCLVSDIALHIQWGSTKSRDQSPPPYIKKTVNVISGGSDLCGNSVRASMTHARRVQSVRAMTSIDSHGPSVLLSFDRGEASELEHPHDDAVVITLDVAHVRMKRMLVDTGSSANILFPGVLKEMEIEDLKAQDTQVTLVGFSGESAVARSFIQLPVYANGVNKLVKFLIVDCPSAYNAILGRPWIHAMKAVASSYHQVIKFPCKGEVREIRGDQLGARKCYSSSLRNKNKL
ncbi:uncharacterized protein LOC115713502 [Cannabis sativa]|uniref:uncharacterized protein LOC115713502 n=1 Tax=Cannabis sativa TaxID=3483 RepID=UPI0029C9FC9B|nr:uncharacterized protein LOC115713502 [Cannabis sativa]